MIFFFFFFPEQTQYLYQHIKYKDDNGTSQIGYPFVPNPSKPIWLWFDWRYRWRWRWILSPTLGMSRSGNQVPPIPTHPISTHSCPSPPVLSHPHYYIYIYIYIQTYTHTTTHTQYILLFYGMLNRFIKKFRSISRLSPQFPA